jgi:two-component system, NarL family, invasion response regulator UvrY
MIKVLIVDDHPVVRKGLKAELLEQPDLRVVAEAADGDEAILKTRSAKPDIILLDISLPGRSGLDVLRQVRSEFPRVHVLMLSTYPEKQYAVRCLKAGARGYLTKESAADELIDAIRKVADGKTYVGEKLGEMLALDIGTPGNQQPHEQLSPREFEILRLIGRGKSLKEIAGILSLSLSTVSTHRSHILVRMQCRSTAELIRYVVEHGLA